MGLYRRGKVWWISITVGGKRYWVSTKTDNRRVAEEIHAKVLLELSRSTPANTVTQPQGNQEKAPKRKDLTYEEFYRDRYLPYCEGRHATVWRTKQYFLYVLPDWFKALTLDQITTEKVERLQSYFIRKQLAPATCNKYISILKASMTKACEWELISEDRLKTIRKVKLLKGVTKRLRYLNPEEIQKLLEACDEHLYPIVLVALHTGMRKSEILLLKWSNVDLKNGLLLLEKTKNRERREIPMNDTLKQVFSRLFVKRRLDVDWVFPSWKSGKPYYDLKRSFNKAVKKAGITDFHFHDLRHTFASQLVMAGVDIRTVQELLGHKSLTMTLRYAHLSHAQKKKAVQTLETRLNCLKSVTESVTVS